MKVLVKVDTTLTVTAGQCVDIPAEDYALLASLGRVEEVKEEEKKKAKKQSK